MNYPKLPNTPQPPQAGDEGFEAFWEKYPRKVAKGQALKAYRAALKKTSHEEIMSGLSAYHPKPGFVAHAATWLNGERWLDEETETDSEVSAGGLTEEEKRILFPNSKK